MDMSGVENLRMLMFATQQDLTNEFLKRLVKRIILDVPGFQAQALVGELRDFATTLDEAHGDGAGQPLPTKGLTSEMWLEKIELVETAILESDPEEAQPFTVRDGH
jgi:hypothetical protein